MTCQYPPSPATTTSFSFKGMDCVDDDDNNYNHPERQEQEQKRQFWTSSRSSLSKALLRIFSPHHIYHHPREPIFSPPLFLRKKQQQHQEYNKKKNEEDDDAIILSNKKKNTVNHHHKNTVVLDDIYKDIIKSIGVGSYADVRLVQSKTSYQMLAIKTFRKRPKNVPERKYMKQINAEYCIASSLDHPNVVKTFDFGRDPATDRSYIVMEYCTDGDLCTAISNGSLRSMDELHCYFKQLLQGLAYLHDVMGIAHRDIKPENLLLHGHILKITDFGVADVMREAWQTRKRHSYDLCGTTSYVAPELYTQREYKGDKADMWSVGIVYYVMQRGEMLFASAKLCDTFYRAYLRYHPDRQYALFNNNKMFNSEIRDMLYRLLDPNPARRYSAYQLLRLPWIAKIPVCCHMSKYHDHVNGYATRNRRTVGMAAASPQKQVLVGSANNNKRITHV